MKRLNKFRPLALAMLFLVAACRATPVYNVEQAAFTAGLTIEQARLAIIRGGDWHGWQVRDIGPGQAVATLNLRNHKAVVDITYDRKTFSIAYKSSTNLDYDGETIHQKYNGWVSNLARSIQYYARQIVPDEDPNIQKI